MESDVHNIWFASWSLRDRNNRVGAAGTTPVSKLICRYHRLFHAHHLLLCFARDSAHCTFCRDACEEMRKAFESLCTPSWVAHFEKRRAFEEAKKRRPTFVPAEGEDQGEEKS